MESRRLYRVQIKKKAFQRDKIIGKKIKKVLRACEIRQGGIFFWRKATGNHSRLSALFNVNHQEEHIHAQCARGEPKRLKLLFVPAEKWMPKKITPLRFAFHMTKIVTRRWSQLQYDSSKVVRLSVSLRCNRMKRLRKKVEFSDVIIRLLVGFCCTVHLT